MTKVYPWNIKAGTRLKYCCDKDLEAHKQIPCPQCVLLAQVKAEGDFEVEVNPGKDGVLMGILVKSSGTHRRSKHLSFQKVSSW